MLNDFVHVDCAETRAVLEGKLSNRLAITVAAYFSDACQSEDYKCALIEDYIFDARETAIANMWLELEAGDHAATVNAMRKFWNI
jgi:hypothetical protein